MAIINQFPSGGGSTLENYTPFEITTSIFRENYNYKTALIVNRVSSTKWALYLVSYGSSSPGTSTSHYPDFAFTPAVDLIYRKDSSIAYTFKAGISYASTINTSSSSNNIQYRIKKGSNIVCYSLIMSITSLASSKQEFMTLETV